MRIKLSEEKSFIDSEKIFELIEKNKNPDPVRVREILSKSLEKVALEPEEVAVLINVEDKELLEEIFSAARKVKEEIYGNRIVLFAPFYIGNSCINDCVYCGFRSSNDMVVRKTLTKEEIVREVEALVRKGHKRLLIVFGEHPMYSPKFIAEAVETIYSVKVDKGGEIRRVNVNAAPQDVEGYKIIKSAGIGTYQVFQETYNEKVYKKLHPRGPKSNFLWRLYALDRAMEGGIDDVAIGALFGLYDWKFEVIGLIYHAKHLDEKYGVGPHTISFPRLEPAINTPFSEKPPYKVSDEDFKKIVAILRLAVPYTGLILTAREEPELRREVIKLGVSQTDAGSNINIGSYSTGEDGIEKSQFEIHDKRSLDEFIRDLVNEDFLPSFCTACYRMGRTGEEFMLLAKPGFVKNFCQPNALFTFIEYLEDYASEETKKAGYAFVDREIQKMEPNVRRFVLKKMQEIKQGKRDVYV